MTPEPSETPFLDAIADIDPEVSIVNGFVVAYSYLDADGEPCYGVRFGGEERTLNLLGLTVVAQRHVFDHSIVEDES